VEDDQVDRAQVYEQRCSQPSATNLSETDFIRDRSLIKSSSYIQVQLITVNFGDIRAGHDRSGASASRGVRQLALPDRTD
jgi:hypothetical protein